MVPDDVKRDIVRRQTPRFDRMSDELLSAARSSESRHAMTRPKENKGDWRLGRGDCVEGFFEQIGSGKRKSLPPIAR